MKKIVILLLSLLAGTATMPAQTVNLTPVPKTMSTKSGSYILKKGLTVSASGLTDEQQTEVNNFVLLLNKATGLGATLKAGTDGDINVALSATKLGDEAYKLTVTEEGVSVTASTATGFFYAFQTLRKILPANVMAEQLVEGEYSLPLVTINDSPRFGYRGFMLDVSRHFFTIEEVKRMIDLMAFYKMNRFHWHLTDDQGWRVEIKKYPKLTTVAASRSNSRETSLDYGYYYINEPYGPYYYTQEQMKDVVAYAKARHIEVIPEIEMPGHLAAAITAYPEFSCNPGGSHNVWVLGGISTDVLNVANPQAVQFAKDILEEVADIFPYDVIHIGGDECPTSAWEGNADCQAIVKANGWSSYRPLQTNFTKEIADFLKTKGKRIACWNESITEKGADTDLMKKTNAMIYCWYPAESAAQKAAQLGLQAIVTKYDNGYYINRKPTNYDYGAGYGTDNLKTVYDFESCPSSVSTTLSKYYAGVQGTFWCEHVSEPRHLEYLALPRLMAVAEAGWTPMSKKNFKSFVERMKLDTALLRRLNYNYHPQYIEFEGAEPSTSTSDMVMPKSSTAAQKYWYKIVTTATGERAGRCMELLSSGSPLLTTYSSQGAEAGRLWTNAQAAETDANNDYQQWAFEEDPSNPGKYAIVCKALPDGSLNAAPTAATVNGYWTYDNSKKHYNFVLGAGGYGKSGDNYYYTINSDKNSAQYMNHSMSGKGYRVNCYNNPSDGNGGLWEFAPLFEATEPEAGAVELIKTAKTLLATARTYADESQKTVGLFSQKAADELRSAIEKPNASIENLSASIENLKASFVWPEKGKYYRITNTLERFKDQSICDDKKNTYLKHTDDPWAGDAWLVTSVGTPSDFTMKIQLRNAATNRYVGAPAGTSVANMGKTVGTSAATNELAYMPKEGDFRLSNGGAAYYPVSAANGTCPNGIVAFESAVHPQGTGWTLTEVNVVTFKCSDTNGADLGTYTFSCPVGESVDKAAPTFPNYEVASVSAEGSVRNVVYKRVSNTVSVVCRDQYGALINVVEASVPVGSSYTTSVPEVDFYTKDASAVSATFVPAKDTVVYLDYTTEAFNGVKKLGKAVSKLENGKSYVIYDTSPSATERIGFRNINPANGQVMQANTIEGTDPYYVWTLQRQGTSGNKFKVFNEYVEKYIPQVPKSGSVIVGTTGDTFTFTLDGADTWKVQGTNGMFWDGVAGSMTGWTSYGHPYKFYEYFAQPYFTVTLKFEDKDGKKLADGKTELVKAGEAYKLVVPAVSNYVVKCIENQEVLDAVGKNVVVRVVYEDIASGITAVTTDKQVQGIYDMQGRRLSRVQGKGLYIVNGRKVLIK